MSNPLVHCSSCILGVARPRSVKFAPVRTRWKGGGACELSSAELPLIRRFALLAGTSQVRGSACDVRVCVSSRVMGSYTPSDRVWATDRCARSREIDVFVVTIDRDRENASETFRSVHRSSVRPRSFIPLKFLRLCATKSIFGMSNLGLSNCSLAIVLLSDGIVERHKSVLVDWDFV